ncbi:MAG: hypothetical protein JXN63_00460 [Candidatus Delongbacteria bacterium]|nr:hypothetical protein [Candidatus Delongbacteria bacterium]
MNRTAERNAYIKVISNRSISGQMIVLPGGFVRKPPIEQEKEILNICRKHLYENGDPRGNSSERISSYRYYFSSDDFLDYRVEEIEALA